MATAYWKLEEKREVSAADVPTALGNGPFLVLRTDHHADATTIYFAGDKKHVASHFAEDKKGAAPSKLRSKPVEVKLEDVTKL